MTNTPMTFEQWFEKQYGKKPMPVVKQGDEPHDSVYMTMFADGAFRGWQACEQQNQTEIDALKYDLDGYMKIANSSATEIVQQSQTIAELVEALEEYSEDVTYDDDILGLRVIKSGEVARQALAKLRG